VQALSIISDIGDMLLAKYSRQPVPQYSENDEDFCQRHAYLRSLFYIVTFKDCQTLDDCDEAGQVD